MNKVEFQELMEKGEADWLDWKADYSAGLLGGKKHQDWDKSRARLMKSVVAIANSDGDGFGYLVYGVKDHRTHRALIGATHSFDDADFQQWFENTFDIPPTFVFQELKVEGHIIGLFKIQRERPYPHVVKTDIGETLCRGQVWYRRGTKNSVALQAELREMFKSVEPYKIGKLRDIALTQIQKHYEEQGRTSTLALLSDKDSRLSQGYELAYFPRTRREVWCGAVDDTYQHILLLKPK